MFFVSILTSDRERDPELWATIWNGEGPPSLKLIGAYNLASNQRVFIWEGESVADLQFMDRFNEVGVLETWPASTAPMAGAWPWPKTWRDSAVGRAGRVWTRSNSTRALTFADVALPHTIGRQPAPQRAAGKRNSHRHSDFRVCPL